jgi:hypothetical protein
MSISALRAFVKICTENMQNLKEKICQDNTGLIGACFDDWANLGLLGEGRENFPRMMAYLIFHTFFITARSGQMTNSLDLLFLAVSARTDIVLFAERNVCSNVEFFHRDRRVEFLKNLPNAQDNVPIFSLFGGHYIAVLPKPLPPVSKMPKESKVKTTTRKGSKSAISKEKFKKIEYEKEELKKEESEDEESGEENDYVPIPAPRQTRRSLENF